MNNKFTYLLSLLLCVMVFPVFAQKIIYISPNNDGIQDVLTVPLSVSDKRYITEWSFVITDEELEALLEKPRRNDSFVVWRTYSSFLLRLNILARPPSEVSRKRWFMLMPVSYMVLTTMSKEIRWVSERK